MLSIRLGAVAVCRAGCASELDTQLCFGQGWLQGFAAGIVFRGQSPAALSPAPCPGVVCVGGNAVDCAVHRGGGSAQVSQGHRVSGPSLGGCWSRCQPRCRFKATPEEQMSTGQLRLHNLFWV